MKRTLDPERLTKPILLAVLLLAMLGCTPKTTTETLTGYVRAVQWDQDRLVMVDEIIMELDGGKVVAINAMCCEGRALWVGMHAQVTLRCVGHPDDCRVLEVRRLP